MRCSKCGAENVKNMKYCVWCKSDLRPSLSANIEPDALETQKLNLQRNSFLRKENKKSTYWENRVVLGLFLALWLNWKEIILHPKRFFSRMPITGGIWGPLQFALIISCLSGIVFVCCLGIGVINLAKPELTKLISLGVIPPIFVIFGITILLYPLFVSWGLFINSIFIHICMWLVGARIGFQATFRVVAYSQAVQAFILF